MRRRTIFTILSAAMYALFTVLMLYGVSTCVGDLTHRSYIAAFLCAAALFVLYLRFGDRLRIIENVYVLTAICLGVHLAAVFIVRLEPAGDYRIFWEYARLLSYNTGCAMLDYVALFPHIFGYSYFISRFMSVFGQSTLMVSIVNACLTTLSGIFIWALVKDIYGKRRAGWAYLLWILCPSKILYNSMVLSDPYYTCLILLFLLLVEKTARTDIKSACLLGIPAGLVLRLVNTARPVAIIPIIAFFIWLFCLKGYKKTFVTFAALMLIVYIPTGTLWNRFMESNLCEKPATGAPGYNVYVGLDSEHGGTHNEEDIDRLFDYYYGDHMTAPEAQEHMLADAKEMVLNGRTDFSSLIPNKFRVLLGNDEGGAYYASEALSPAVYPILCVLSNIWYYFAVLMAAAGAFCAITRLELSVLQLAPLYTIGLILAQMLVEVSGRYHYSIIPMLVITAASFSKSNNEEESD